MRTGCDDTLVPARSAAGIWAARGWLLGLVLLCSTLPNRAYVSYINKIGQPQKWSLAAPSPFVHTNVVNPTTRAVRYFLAADAFSSANRTAELNAARACFDQWQAVPGSILRFEEGGLATGNLDINTTDNTNLVYWAKNSTIVNGGFDNIAGTTGVTFSDYFSDSTLAEADIVLNGVSGGGYSWFTDFNDSVTQAQFVESVLLHEIGHFVGLSHSPVGASTMYPRGGGGVSVQAGLSSDEFAALHALYPSAGTLAKLGRISGVVSLGSKPVLGAIITAEDSFGNTIAGTVSRTNGFYELPAMPPGTYGLRATPLDPASASWYLFRGPDIDQTFFSAEPNFLPSPNVAVTVTASGNAAQNFAVLTGTPAVRINRIWPPSTDATLVVVNYAVSIPLGAADFEVGVYCTDLPAAEAVLRLTGNDLTFGPTTVRSNAFPGVNPPLHLVSVPVHMAPNATPGMRSLALQQGTTVVYANGFVELPPSIPDFNFDGVDDRFQRFFPVWTAPEARPNGADPDQDGFSNEAEYLAGTNPLDPQSVLKIESARWDASGVTLTWPSAPGKRYQVLSRSKLDSVRGWQPVGAPVLSTGNHAQYLDPVGSVDLQFYRIQAIP